MSDRWDAFSRGELSFLQAYLPPRSELGQQVAVAFIEKGNPFRVEEPPPSVYQAISAVAERLDMLEVKAKSLSEDAPFAPRSHVDGLERMLRHEATSAGRDRSRLDDVERRLNKVVVVAGEAKSGACSSRERLDALEGIMADMGLRMKALEEGLVEPEVPFAEIARKILDEALVQAKAEMKPKTEGLTFVEAVKRLRDRALAEGLPSSGAGGIKRKDWRTALVRNRVGFLRWRGGSDWTPEDYDLVAVDWQVID